MGWKCASETLDRTRSEENVYEGFESGYALADELHNRADNYVCKVKGKNGQTYERKLREDAVIGYAMIINPPSEVCMTWSDEEYQKFYDDSWETMCELYPQVFGDQNVLMRAEHHDEGIDRTDRHMHIIGTPTDEDGKYNGKQIDGMMFVNLNREYPRMMRAKGWHEMDDLDTTDYSRMGTDAEYKASRKVKKQEHGRSVNNHIQSKLKEQLDVVDRAQDALNAQQKILNEQQDALDVQEKNLRIREKVSIQSDIYIGILRLACISANSR